MSQGSPTPGPSAGRLLLLDLPPELLHEALRDAPHSLRSTCRAFRDALDGSCRELRLHRAASRQRRLKDLTALLRRLPKLQSLDNNHHDFKTLPFLTACPTLTHLTLSHSAVPSHHLKALAACPLLISLNLSQSPFMLNLDFLSSLPALHTLNLCDCESLTSLAPLAAHCPALRWLRVSRGRGGWMELGPLAALTALQCLQVRNHAGSALFPALDIAPLSSCTALQVLGLMGNVVPSLAPLAHCTLLQTLHVDCSEAVTSLVPLAGCAATLTGLCLRARSVADLTPLATFTALSSLSLIDCAVTGVGALAALGPTLCCLTLACCELVVELTSLAPFTALKELDVSGTNVASFLPLQACKQLQVLRGLVQGEESVTQAGLPMLCVLLPQLELEFR